MMTITASLLVAGNGCGNGSSDVPTGTVSGTVSYEGKPVTEGKVEFLADESGEARTAKIDSSGKFVIDEPIPIGEYVVTISPPELTEEPGAGGMAEPKMKAYPNIPEAYRSPITTDLTVKIEEGENTATLKMTKNGGKRLDQEDAP